MKEKNFHAQNLGTIFLFDLKEKNVQKDFGRFEKSMEII